MVKMDTSVEVVQEVVNLALFPKVVMVEEVMVDMDLDPLVVVLREVVEMRLTELAAVAVVLEVMVIIIILTNLVMVETEQF